MSNTTDNPPTTDAMAHEIVRSTNLRDLKWRHHGLGMLQGEIDEQTRIHLWDPSLRTIPDEGFRDVHDHRFDLESTVIIGKVMDVRYMVAPTFIDEGQTDAWEIKHAKVQVAEDMRVVDTGAPGSSPNTRWIARVKVAELYWAMYGAGEAYTIPRRTFHTTKVFGFAMTLVRRTGFDDRPARILGKGHSAIIKHADEDPARVEHEQLIDRIVWHACDQVRGLS